MYSVSNDFILAMLQPVIQSKIQGVIGNVPFTEAHILKGSLTIYAQNSGQDAIDIGTASAKELNITLMNSLNLTRSTLYGQEIRLDYLLKLADGTYEHLPLGSYIITEASWTLKGIEIVAYDYMSKFDKYFDETTAEYPMSARPYQMIEWVCEQQGVQFGMTEQEVQALPNGTIYMEYIKGTAQTYREFIAYLAAACGCFAIIDRTDKLIFKRYSGAQYDSYGATERLTGGSFSDFMTRYNAYTVQDFASGQNVVVKTNQYVGLSMDLGRNPFLNSASKSVLRPNVLTELANINFAPFSCRFNFPPIYDLGDCIKLTGGIGDDNPHVINYFSWNYNVALTLEGYGKNPALAQAISQLDKEISGVANFTDLMATGYITATNRNEILIDDSKKKVLVSMAAQSSKIAEGVFTCMIPITVTEPGSVTFYHELGFEPLREETVDLEVGEHIITLHDYMTFPAGVATNFRIRVQASEGFEGTIDEFAARSSLLVPSAQQATFDGNIIIDEEAIRWNITEPTFKTDTESISVDTQVPTGDTLSDTASEYNITETLFDSADDNIRILVRFKSRERKLEDGRLRRLEEETQGVNRYRRTEEESG